METTQTFCTACYHIDMAIDFVLYSESIEKCDRIREGLK